MNVCETQMAGEAINFMRIDQWIITAEWNITSSESTARTPGLSMARGNRRLYIQFAFFAQCYLSICKRILNMESRKLIEDHLFGTVIHKSNKMRSFCVQIINYQSSWCNIKCDIRIELLQMWFGLLFAVILKQWLSHQIIPIAAATRKARNNNIALCGTITKWDFMTFQTNAWSEQWLGKGIYLIATAVMTKILIKRHLYCAVHIVFSIVHLVVDKQCGTVCANAIYHKLHLFVTFVRSAFAFSYFKLFLRFNCDCWLFISTIVEQFLLCNCNLCSDEHLIIVCNAFVWFALLNRCKMPTDCDSNNFCSRHKWPKILAHFATLDKL